MDAKNKITQYWQIIVAIALVLFNVGYTVKTLETVPSREEVRESIKAAIDEHKVDSKYNYVPIEQIPELKTKLDAMSEQLGIITKKLDKMEDKLIYGKAK